jgi:hypothetical protein
VFLARQLLRPFLPHFAPPGSPPPPGGLRGWLRRWFAAPPLPPFPSLRHNAVLNDLRILDMFEEMTRAEVPVGRRTGNWVQQYRNLGDVLQYLETNLGNIEFVRDIVRERQP